MEFADQVSAKMTCSCEEWGFTTNPQDRATESVRHGLCMASEVKAGLLAWHTASVVKSLDNSPIRASKARTGQVQHGR